MDTHTASWNWGDGNITTGTVTGTNGSGSVSNTHTYTQAGVYTINLTITDNDTGEGTQTFKYLSAYNPTPTGLFTGAALYTSPVGADSNDLSATGKVHFGITSKYGTNNQPTGNVNMNFKAGNIDFKANSITILVINNGQATLRGTGTVNGTGNYTFLVTGNDSQNTIRFQIKDQTNTIIYDTQPGAADTAAPTTSVIGNVIVH